MKHSLILTEKAAEKTMIAICQRLLKGQCHDKSCSPEALGRWIKPKPLTAQGFYIFLISCSVPTKF